MDDSRRDAFIGFTGGVEEGRANGGGALRHSIDAYRIGLDRRRHAPRQERAKGEFVRIPY